MSICPYCEATLVSPLACASCGALLDLESEVSPFAVFGLAPSWELDVKALKRELLRMSRQVHPDFYATAEAEVRQRAERASATVRPDRSSVRIRGTVKPSSCMIDRFGGEICLAKRPKTPRVIKIT